MNSLLIPEKNKRLLKYYHNSSKFLIPGILFSTYFHYYDRKNAFKYVNYFNTLNIGYHSYVSISCVITDYIKPKNISKIVRGVNLSTHLIAITGYYYYLNKNY